MLPPRPGPGYHHCYDSGPISPNRLLCDYYDSGPIKAPMSAQSALIGFPITYYEGCTTTTWCYLSRPGYHQCHDSGPIKPPISARSALIGFPITYYEGCTTTTWCYLSRPGPGYHNCYDSGPIKPRLLSRPNRQTLGESRGRERVCGSRFRARLSQNDSKKRLSAAAPQHPPLPILVADREREVERDRGRHLRE